MGVTSRASPSGVTNSESAILPPENSPAETRSRSESSVEGRTNFRLVGLKFHQRKSTTIQATLAGE